MSDNPAVLAWRESREAQVQADRLRRAAPSAVPTPADPVETIVAAAVLVAGRIWSVPAPGRHHDCIALYGREAHARFPQEGPLGFLTSTGRFVDRVDAASIVRANGQPLSPRFRASISVLYSEDLW